MKNQFYTIALLLCVYFTSCTSSDKTQTGVATTDAVFIEELSTHLNHMLTSWYPRTVDSVNGGFLSNFDCHWEPTGPHLKMIVTQSRHIWTTSSYGAIFHDSNYQKYADWGFDFICAKMWDNEHGGFYMVRDTQGNNVKSPYSKQKRAYGQAFSIYAMACYFRQSGNKEALDFAIKTFEWLDEHAHDHEYLGYFDIMAENGDWLFKTDHTSTTGENERAPWKDHNSSIHILEAFSELYKVYPDPLLRSRLTEMLHVVRDHIVSDKGSLYLHSYRDWTPVSYKDSTVQKREEHFYFDHLSFGHDVETAFLMLEASESLGLENDTATLNIAKKIVDFSLEHGWDKVNGGLYYAGYFDDNTNKVKIIRTKKEWWVQAEALNAFLLMSKLFPEEKKYRAYANKQWEYIKKYQIDSVNHIWYHEGIDQCTDKDQAISSDWKVNYHNGRALMNCILMLEGKSDIVHQFKNI